MFCDISPGMNGQHTRLQAARRHAGFATAADAVRRFGWHGPTYYGHENGSRGIKRDVATNYAQAFRVSVAWLMFGQGAMTSLDELHPPPHAGVSEDAVAYIAPTKTQADLVRSAFAQGGRHATITHRAAVTLPDLLIAAGDLLICDLSRQPEPGEIALVSVEDGSGEMSYLIRRFLPPFLWAAPQAPHDPLLQTEHPAISVRHPVVGIIRGA